MRLASSALGVMPDVLLPRSELLVLRGGFALPSLKSSGRPNVLILVGTSSMRRDAIRGD